MKILIIGGGPGGLSFAALMAAADPSHDISVIERNAAKQIPGWGVTLRSPALAFLELEKRLSPQRLEGRALRHQGQLLLDLPNPPDIALVTFSRSDLIQALLGVCHDRGVHVTFGVDGASVPDSELARYHLVVASDGTASATRRRHAEAFKPTTTLGSNRYAWLGTSRPFHKLTLLLRDQDIPALAWAYKYSADWSTFIVECTEKTWESKLSGRSPEENCADLAKVFETELGGASVLAGGSIQWQRYPVISCERLHHGNMVLVGDAAHTTHFSQGFGTMFAFDDALTLHTALQGSGSIPQALSAYEALQRPKIAAFQETAATSMHWSERLLQCVELGDQVGTAELIASRWPNNQVTASPLGSFKVPEPGKG